MKPYLAPEWAQILAYNGLDNFDALWRLDAGWFEPRNERRGGWSGVSRHELRLPAGGSVGVFIKRQQNHQTRTVAHPRRGVPTFERELRLIERYRASGIPTLEPIYYAARRVGGDSQAILITRELEGFRPMAELVRDWLDHGAPERQVRQRYLAAIAHVLSAMHDHGIVHNCFFPKHVFVRSEEGKEIAVRIIDLEKSRWRPLRSLCMRRDLFAMIRHAQWWPVRDRLYFFREYLGQRKLDPAAKRLWRSLEARGRRKDRFGRPEKMLAVPRV